MKEIIIAYMLSIINVKVEHRTNPIGVDAAKPVFSWQLSSPKKSITQTAYRIVVADDSLLLKKGIGNIWDSKRVTSPSSIEVPYGGKQLLPAKKYYWQVLVWNNKNDSAISTINYWQMGLPTQKDWANAQWIAYENLPDSNRIVPAEHGNGKKEWGKREDILPLLRKTFTLSKNIKNATAFIAGLGHFEMSINGQKISDHFLDPGWTRYDKQALYVTFDVTSHLQNGNNAIGVLLGNGFYYLPGERYRKMTGAHGYPKMICRLVIEYTDGSTESIVSDRSWKAAPSSIVFSSLYGGEDYDARLEQQGWDTPSFNDSNWKQVVTTSAIPLQSQTAGPVKVMQVFEPIKATPINQKKVVFDMGQNMSGIPQITVQGNKGDTIKILTAELLKEDGTVNQKATGSPSYYLYILKGNGLETYQPHFSYYGYRYVQVENVQYNSSNNTVTPNLISVKGLHTRNAAATIGSFNCSNGLFNNIFNLIDWSIKSNMQSVYTDCPHRERLGWLEQVHLVGSSIQYNYDIHTLSNKVLQDIRVQQQANGLIPSTVPEYTQMHFANGYFRDSPEWGSTGIIHPWQLYEWYGDKNILIQQYPAMQQYMAYLKTKDSSGLLMYGLSDWYDLGPNKPGFCQLTPMGLTATAYYYYDLCILAKTANLLGKKEDAEKYATWAVGIKTAFNKAFFNSHTKQYGSGSQTSNAIAVYMNLVDEKDKAAVVENVVKDIRNHNNSLTAGDIGFRYLLQVLNDAGRSDVIFDMNNRSDVPGYGYQIAKGATALTESWQALPTVSNNHLMLGHMMEWLYEGLAGIGQAKGSVGYSNIVIRPQVVGNITYANAAYQCPYGLIKSQWQKQGNLFKLHATVPANTTATVYLPVSRNAVITMDGKAMKATRIENNKAVIKIGSGNYEFTVQ